MNVLKMRRQMARNTSDAVWRTFDLESDTIHRDIMAWQNHWAHQMRIKHKGKDMELTVFASDIENFENPRYRRYQMTAVERSNNVNYTIPPPAEGSGGP